MELYQLQKIYLESLYYTGGKKYSLNSFIYTDHKVIVYKLMACLF